MSHSQKVSGKAPTGFPLAYALILAVLLIVPGCKPSKKAGTPARQAYGLNLGKSIELDVDYPTGKISTASTSPKIILGFSTKDMKLVITIDCSRLGGGLIQGKYQAYLRGAEVEQGEFQCLYQHAREVVLNGTADAVKLSDLHFTHVIE